MARPYRLDFIYTYLFIHHLFRYPPFINIMYKLDPGLVNLYFYTLRDPNIHKPCGFLHRYAGVGGGGGGRFLTILLLFIYFRYSFLLFFLWRNI